MIVGGLIGHFATKSNMEDISTTQAPATADPVVDENRPNPDQDRENRDFLFAQASADELNKTVK